MKVIFIKDVAGVAKRNEIQEVKNGYARNFLIPNGLAKRATSSDIKKVEEIKKTEKEKIKQELALTKKMVEKLEGKKFELNYKTGEEGQLFEAVTSKKIAEALQKEDFNIQEDQIKLDKPIKSLGEFPIEIKFKNNLKAKIVVNIKKEK